MMQRMMPFLLIKCLLYLNNDKNINGYNDLFYCLYDYHCFAYLSQQYGSDERAKEEKKTDRWMCVHTSRLSNTQSSIINKRSNEKDSKCLEQ